MKSLASRFYPSPTYTGVCSLTVKLHLLSTTPQKPPEIFNASNSLVILESSIVPLIETAIKWL